MNAPPNAPSEADLDAVVFDVGRVLFDFQYQDLIAFLVEHGLRYDSPGDLFDLLDVDRYERGGIDNAAFLDQVNRLLSQPVPADELTRRWTRIFSPMPAMLDLAARLNQTTRVYLLSNASALHWDYLEEEHGLGDIGRGQLASFHSGHRKPEAAIYRDAEARFDLDPRATVFVDDLEENVDGARACGWMGIHHRSAESTISQLAALPGPHRDVLG